jgi:hypothetical protein
VNTRAPFAIRSFGAICSDADRFIRTTCVAAFEIAAVHGREAGIAWILSDDRAVEGGWAEFACAAFRALSVAQITGREASNGN